MPQDVPWELPTVYHGTPRKKVTKSQIRAEELWNSWFRVNEIIRNDKSVSAATNPKPRINQNQPIGEQVRTRRNSRKNWQVRAK